MKFTELTEQIVMTEGKKESVNIAQVKEITKISLQILASLPQEDLEELLSKYK